MFPKALSMNKELHSPSGSSSSSSARHGIGMTLFTRHVKPRSPLASCLFRLFPLYLPRQSPLPLFAFQKIPALTRQEEKQIQRLPLTKEEFGGGKAQGKAALRCFAHTTSHRSGKCSNPPVLHPDCSVEWEGGSHPGEAALAMWRSNGNLWGF